MVEGRLQVRGRPRREPEPSHPGTRRIEGAQCSVSHCSWVGLRYAGTHTERRQIIKHTHTRGKETSVVKSSILGKVRAQGSMMSP